MKKKMKPRGSILAALDIGSSKIACFIGRVIDDEGSVEVLGVGYQAAQGVKSGTIVDLNAAESTIRQTVHAAENMAADAMKGYPLRDVIINVSGNILTSHNLSADIKVRGQTISQTDIQRAMAKAQSQELSADHELVHTIPVGFSIDGHEGVSEPVGMVGQNLSVGIHMVTSQLGPLQNIATCIEQSHLDISALCCASYAAGLSSLVEDEMDLGCTVIDMGAGVTSLAVFQAGHMIYADAVPIGGAHVTNDIARGLTCKTTDAERLKTLYGSAIVSGSDDSELIDVPQMGEGEGGAPNHVPRSLLIGIIQPRLEEILELTREKLDQSGLSQVIGRRIVMTGGACQIPGLRDLSQMVLDKQVRIGRPIRINGLPDAVSGPAFATTAGLLTYVTQHQNEMPADIMAAAEPESIWERTKQWWKENW